MASAKLYSEIHLVFLGIAPDIQYLWNEDDPITCVAEAVAEAFDTHHVSGEAHEEWKDIGDKVECVKGVIDSYF